MNNPQGSITIIGSKEIGAGEIKGILTITSLNHEASLRNCSCTKNAGAYSIV